MDSNSDDDSNMDLIEESSNGDATSNIDTDAEIDAGDTEVEAFDTNLPAAHNYLGELERVSGVQYLEPGKNYTLPIIRHNSLVFPGETLPMILSTCMFMDVDFTDDGLLFGLVFPELRTGSNLKFYGVTCQIYEKGTDRENLSIKSRAYQRFFIKNTEDMPEFPVRNRTRYATVTILPEIELSDPIYGHDSNNLSKFRNNETLKAKLLRYQSKSVIWTEFIYKMYDVRVACEKIKKFLLTLKIDTAPMDLVAMSFWFSQNAILSTECRRKAFLTNSVLERILLVCQTLQEEKYIVCKHCSQTISRFDSLFPMSKEGVRTNFRKSHGFIHDTHTVTTTLPDAVTISGNITSEFCWFPGYKYQYVHCGRCSHHLGWKYFSRNLMPRSFLELSGTNVYFDNVSNLHEPIESDDTSYEEW